MNILGFLRFGEWWYLNGIFILGFFYCLPCEKTAFKFALGLLVSSLYLACGYALNNYEDSVQEDTAKAKECRVNQLYKYFPYFLLLLNIILSLLISRVMFFVVFLGGFLSWAYSARPLRLKQRPVLRIFVNALGFSLLFLLGAESSGLISGKALLFFFYIFMIFVPIDIIHCINDASVDEETNTPNPASKFGIRKSIRMFVLFFVPVCLYSFWLYNNHIIGSGFVILNLLFFIITLFMLILSYRKNKDKLSGYKGIKSKSRVIFAAFGLALFIILIMSPRP